MIKKLLLILWFALLLTACAKESPSDPNIDLNATNWKKTLVWFVATWCPHCQEEVPVLDKFYREHKNNVNMQLMVTDWKKFTWDYIIPQDPSNSLTYEQATQEQCSYVPSFVIYDENKNITSKFCWKKLTYEELETLLLDPNKKTMDTTYQLEKLKDWDLVAILTTTNGTIKIKLFPNDAPKTVTNFVWLAKKWYYDWTTFHRVIKNFMIQWWDPEWTWMWWESIYGSEFEDEISDKLFNLTWSLSMANAWANTNGSQFFINQVDNSYLNGKHTVFWQVIEWMENVDKIANSKTWANDKPQKEIKLIKVEIKKQDAGKLVDYNFNLDEELKKIEEIKKQEDLKKSEELKKIEEEKVKKAQADKDRIVKKWDKVSVNYIWTTTADWKEFDNSYKNWTPIEFEVWAWLMIKWFDEWVIWMKLWEKKTLKLKALDAYGEYSKENIHEVTKSDLKSFTDNWIKLEVWTKLPTMYWKFPIVEVSENAVKVDLNPALAWKDLTFEVELVEFKN